MPYFSHRVLSSFLLIFCFLLRNVFYCHEENTVGPMDNTDQQPQKNKAKSGKLFFRVNSTNFRHRNFTLSPEISHSTEITRSLDFLSAQNSTSEIAPPDSDHSSDFLKKKSGGRILLAGNFTTENMAETAPDGDPPALTLAVKLSLTNRTSEIKIDASDFLQFKDYEFTYASSYRMVNPGPVHISANPYILKHLRPGHEYFLNFSAKTENGQLARTQKSIVTNPAAVLINESLTTVTTNSIRLVGRKADFSLQDYFLVDLYQSDSLENKFSQTIKFDDSDGLRKRKLDFRIEKLNPGRFYNVTIRAHRKDRIGPAYTANIATKPLPPRDVRIFDSGDSSEFFEIRWAAPNNSGVDKYFVEIRPPDLKTITKEVVPDTILKLTKSINKLFVPGTQFDVTVSSIKGSISSDGITARLTLKPSPPINITVQVNYEKNFFVMLAILRPASMQDYCILRYEGDSGKFIESKSSSIFDSSVCQWDDVELTPGKSYEFRTWTVSGELHSNPILSTIVPRPAFNFEKFGLRIVPFEHSLQIRWDPIKIRQIFPKFVGHHGLLNFSLKENTSLSVMFSPLNLTSIDVVGLTAGRCYTALGFSVANGSVSGDSYVGGVRTLPPALVVDLRNPSARSAQVAARPVVGADGEPSSRPGAVDPSCRLIVAATETLTQKSVEKIWPLHAEGFTSELPAELTPFSSYVLNSKISCGDSRTEKCEETTRQLEYKSFSTLEAVPGPVAFVTAKSLTSTVAEIAWKPPNLTNGIITGYTVTLENAHGLESFYSNSSADSTRILVRNLTGGTEYMVNVRALTVAGQGELYCFERIGDSCDNFTFETIVSAPPKPLEKVEIVMNTVQTTVFTITYNWSMFSTKHGLLSRYVVIVAEGEQPTDPPSDLTWADVQRLNAPWPPYVAIEKPLPDQRTLPSTPTYDVIGLDRPECSKSAPGEEDFSRIRAESHPEQPQGLFALSNRVCNGPLKPGTKYRVKIRLYTTSQLYTDGEYSDIVTTHTDSGSTIGSIVATVFSLLAVVAVILGAQLFLRSRGVDPLRRCLKKERQKYFSANSLTSNRQLSCVDGPAAMGSVATGNRRQRSLRERANIDGRLDRLHNCPPGSSASTLTGGRTTGVTGGVALPPTVRPSADHATSRPVRSVDFSQHLRLMSADSDFRFSEEYEDLKQVGRTQPCTAADLSCNRNKNRFTNILPYDHSRVKLIPVDDEEGSDYINASYIPGFNSPREFIATQGPMPSTRDDFWRMVVEQNCSAVVNLTKCVEKGREKCDQYWPTDNQSVCYGDVEILVLNETRFPDWTIRELKVTTPDQSQPRTLRHYHFTAWPDFGVPDKPHTLVRFARAVRSRAPTPLPSNAAIDGGRPVVVHCSAGVGRSGTFIALDRIMQQIERRKRRRTTNLSKDGAESIPPHNFDASSFHYRDAANFIQTIVVDKCHRRLSNGAVGVQSQAKDGVAMEVDSVGRDGNCGEVGDDLIDVFGVVHDMRKERVSMVQTEQQYICIHQCLLCVLESAEFGVDESGAFPYVFNRQQCDPYPHTNLNLGSVAEVHQNPAFEDDEGIAESGL